MNAKPHLIIAMQTQFVQIYLEVLLANAAKDMWEMVQHVHVS